MVSASSVASPSAALIASTRTPAVVREGRGSRGAETVDGVMRWVVSTDLTARPRCPPAGGLSVPPG
jgi:hypothetical protein